jgi:hypothetical protein
MKTPYHPYILIIVELLLGENSMKSRFLITIGGSLFLIMPVTAVNVQANPSNSQMVSIFPTLEEIKLTPAQQQKLSILSRQALAEVRNALTPDQRVKFNRSLATGIGLKKSLMAADLSLPQQLQFRNMLPPKQQQVNAVLTPSQQQQVRSKTKR